MKDDDMGIDIDLDRYIKENDLHMDKLLAEINSKEMEENIKESFRNLELDIELPDVDELIGGLTRLI